MRLSSSLRRLFTSALLIVAACRGGGNGDDTPQPDAPPNPDDTTIYDIQNPDGRVPEGTTLNIKGVVVTAIDTYGERADGTRTGNIWIQEPAGGAYSGVLVFGAPASDVADLEVGDIIDLAGASKIEFALTGTTGDMTGRKTTELQPGDSGSILITPVSSGAAPTPEVVDIIAIAQLDDSGTRPTARDNELEKWEGVLIKYENVSQISTVSLISMEPNFQRFKITGGIELDTSLSAFPSSVAVNECYASVTGIGDYFFSWKILPRDTSAIETGGTSCPAPEEGDALCGNGMDDDYDSFADCADFSCQATAPACVTDTSVADIQMGTTTGTVMLTNVVITSLSKDGKHLWVADNLAAAAYEGVYVYRGGGAAVLTPEYVVGATVNVMGNVDEFDTGTPEVGDTLTEIANSTVTFVAAPGGLPTALTTQTAATLGSITDGEPYEGVLVRLATLKVTNNALGNGKVQLTDNNGDTITMDDDIFDYDMAMPPNDTCFATLTAISTVQLIDDVRTIVPRSLADMVVGAGCN